jgi:hypothetical protein
VKPCIACGVVKPLTEYYRHPQMADGHLNKCKPCVCAAVRERCRVVAGDRREYEKARSKRPERRQAVLEYQRTQRARHPEKNRARVAVARALRDGRLVAQPCEVCGAAKAQAHHEDYTRPLDVQWLCFTHHRQEHGQLTAATPVKGTA